jgi:hypothetical protein
LDHPTNQNISELLNTKITWPPQDRGTAREFLAAANGRELKQKPFSNRRLKTIVSAKVDHVRRFVFLKNLKAGSSTVDNLITEMTRAVLHNPVKIVAEFNETENLRRCSRDPTRDVTCTPHWLHLPTLPTEVSDHYFIFSFVRDPFSRVVSAHHEVNPGPFTDILKGISKMAQNPHYSGQVHQLTRAVFSGERVRLDFVGKLENMDAEWARLAPALDASAAHLTPQERRELVLPLSSTQAMTGAPLRHVEQHRSSAVAHGFGETSATLLPFSSDTHFTQLHALLVCRRYVQDLVCYDMEVPRVCIDHVDLVLDVGLLG